MKTPNLDNLINDLKAYDRNDMLSDNGRNQLNEYEAIKRALSIADVVGPSKPFKCEKCGSDWGEIRATCFSCNHESNDLST